MSNSMLLRGIWVSVDLFVRAALFYSPNLTCYFQQPHRTLFALLCGEVLELVRNILDLDVLYWLPVRVVVEHTLDGRRELVHDDTTEKRLAVLARGENFLAELFTGELG